MEWMYQGGFAAQEEASKRKEKAMLLGKPAELPTTEEEKTGVNAITESSEPQADLVLDNPHETWARLNADPLLWMKRQEQDKVKSVVSNPYAMMKLKEEAKQRKREKKDSKKSKDHKKKKSKHKEHAR